MKRVAIVVQRCHESVVGGSEALAWQYARLLSSRFEVEILSSTASDYMTWKNDLPPGVTLRDGIPVRRFPVDITREGYWFELHARLMREVHPTRERTGAERAYWREALEDEFIRFQGPYCPDLHAYLAGHGARFDAVVFCTYLYPTTYFGIREIPAAKAILVPTLHDEPPAYLRVFAQRYGACRHRIWLTDSEQRVASRLWGSDDGDVIGMAVEHTAQFDAVVFCTYLYPTTYFGIREIPAAKAILVPTLHDEPPAYLRVFAQRYGACRHRIWLTDSEQRVASRLWGSDDGDVIGMAVEHTESTEPERRDVPYFLYSGRIEQGKGCHELVEAFLQLRMRSRIDAKLVLTGVDKMNLPKRPDIEFLGFVDEHRKLALMAGAAAFVLPSEYESFSIVTLEAMAQRTPVIVNGRCEVLHDHIERSGAGFHYRTVDELAASMERVLKLDAAERVRLGDAGRRYVLDRYSEDEIRERLVAAVERIIAAD